jgi:hypothetical protein
MSLNMKRCNNCKETWVEEDPGTCVECIIKEWRNLKQDAEVQVMFAEEDITNGEHVFRFPVYSSGRPASLGRCQGPCGKVALYKEVTSKNDFGPCLDPSLLRNDR